MRALDGLPGRSAGPWAREKLAFINYFGSAAIDATLKKRDRVYVDLFAGPGINIIEDTREEFEGATLRILQLGGASHPELGFTATTAVNIDPEDHRSLNERIARLSADGRCRMPATVIDQDLGDANLLIPSILGRYHRKAYLLVFADLENPSQWPWSSIEALRSSGHESLDLYMLFPFEMGVRRLLNFQGPILPENAATLDRFFGCENWRSIVAHRITPAQSRQMGRELEALYLDRLSILWTYVQRTAVMYLSGHRGLYRMIFASDHEAGNSIAQWAKKRGLVEKDQASLDLGGL